MQQRILCVNAILHEGSAQLRFVSPQREVNKPMAAQSYPARSIEQLGKCLAVMATAMALQGCPTIPMASTQADAVAKRFEPSATDGMIYVFRDGTFFGGAHTLPVAVNGRIVGASIPKSYMVLKLSPGKHVLASPAVAYRTMVVNVEAGNLYFVRHSVVSEFMLQTVSGDFELVDGAEGRAAVAACKLSEIHQ